MRIKAAADHPRDEVPGCHLVNQKRTLARAVFEHGHTVGDLKDLLEPMRYVNHAELSLTQFADYRKQGLRLRDRQGCGRFVKDDELSIDRESLGNLDKLLLGRRESLDRRLWIGIQSDLGQQGDRPSPLLASIDEAPAPRRLSAREDVFRDAQRSEEAALLEDDGYAGPLGVALVAECTELSTVPFQ